MISPKEDGWSLSRPENISVLGVDGGDGTGTPLQYFCLENPMDGGAW